MPQTSPSSVGNGLDRSEPLPYTPQQNFIPRPLRDVEDAVPYIYFEGWPPYHHLSPPQFLISNS